MNVRRMAWTLTLAALAALSLQSCASRPKIVDDSGRRTIASMKPHPPAATATATATTAPTAPTPDVKTTPDSGRTPPERVFTDPVAHLSPMELEVEVKPAAPAAGVTSSMAAAMAASVEGALAKAGHRLGSKDPALKLSVSVSLKQFDKFGEYYVFDAEGGVSAVDPDARRTVLRESASARGVRALGKEAGEKAAADALAPLLSAKAAEAVSRLLGAMSAAKIDFDLNAMLKCFGLDDKGVHELLHAAMKIDGVFSLTQISDDGKTLSVKIVYDKAAFPNGLVYERAPEKPLKGAPASLLSRVFKIPPPASK